VPSKSARLLNSQLPLRGRHTPREAKRTSCTVTAAQPRSILECRAGQRIQHRSSDPWVAALRRDHAGEPPRRDGARATTRTLSSACPQRQASRPAMPRSSVTGDSAHRAGGHPRHRYHRSRMDSAVPQRRRAGHRDRFANPARTDRRPRVRDSRRDLRTPTPPTDCTTARKSPPTAAPGPSNSRSLTSRRPGE
jgi:hypothetical protein